METKKELVVSAIENGTVIDHIPTEAVYQVIHILGLENYKDEVLIGNHLESGKLGRKGIIKDIKTWEVDSLIRYMKEAYPQINPTDTVSGTEYNGKKYGFYFIKQQETDKPDSTYATDTKVYLNYTGKLLNGQVFDTTIEKVAKDAGIYKQGQKYEPAFVTWAAEYKDLKFGTSSSDLIDGFKFALFQMKPHEKGVALFYSGLGYKETGSGNSIPGYSPLIFEFELVDKK